jgi:glutaredoxin-related protein
LGAGAALAQPFCLSVHPYALAHGRSIRCRRGSGRNILDEAHVHPAMPGYERVSGGHRAGIQSIVASNDVVVVGMAQNPNPRRARKLLDAHAIPYKYLEYGSYLSGWHRRLALKIWTGWPTFPMIFVKGVLIGGASDLDALVLSGELVRMLRG